MCACLVLGVLSASATRDIVPVPVQLTWGNGDFPLTQQTTISYGNLPNGEQAARYLQEAMKKLTGVELRIVDGNKGDIRLAKGRMKADQYTLNVTTTGIELTGGSYEAVAWGIGTLRQLTDERSIPCVSINDQPRFGWRGFHFDCSRHFFTVTEVKEIIDMMALYKYNRFHWHLTDDEGWRVEIKKYPKLTEQGAWRKWNGHDRTCMQREKAEDNPDFRIPTDRLRINGTDTVYGGYYTQAELREVVRYAKQRGIEIMPEIDMPGHMLAAIQAYEGISCFPITGWGDVFSTPMCPGKDKMLEFCKDIWTEIFDIFPFNYVHIGGDEVEMKNWKKCPDCQARIKAKGLKNEKELQAWFTHQIEAHMNKHGRKMMGWDEIREGGLSKTATVSWWRGQERKVVEEVTAHGNDVVYCPTTCFYIDYAETPNYLPMIYDFDMLPATLSDKQKQHVLGVQANLWCEYVPTRERAFYQYFPRMIAVAELAWSQPSRKSYADFQRRLPAQYRLLNRYNVPYHFPALEGVYKKHVFTDRAKVDIVNRDPTSTLRYTTDGSIPQKSSPVLLSGQTIDESKSMTVRPFGHNDRGGEIINIDYEKQGMLSAIQRPASLTQGLNATWYDHKGPLTIDIHSSKAYDSKTLDAPTVPYQARSFTGVIITGYIDIPADGIYTFAMPNNGAAQLKIDGNAVVNHSRTHLPHEEMGQAALCAGLHRIEIRLWGRWSTRLNLTVTAPDGKQLPAETTYYR